MSQIQLFQDPTSKEKFRFIEDMHGFPILSDTHSETILYHDHKKATVLVDQLNGLAIPGLTVRTISKNPTKITLVNEFTESCKIP